MSAGQMLQIDCGQRRLPLFVAGEAGHPKPAVIIVHEIFGLNEHIKDIALRFAAEGYAALAPDLFAGAAGLPEDRSDLEAMRAVWQAIPDCRLIDDLKLVKRFGEENGYAAAGKTGAVGYCMGGAIAYMLAGSDRQLAFVADYYGRIFYPQLSDTKPRHPIDYTSGIGCPVLGLFAGQDELITATHIARLQEALKQQGVPFEIEIFGQARHAFFNDTREFYCPQAAARAWKATLDFIGQSLNAQAGSRC